MPKCSMKQLLVDIKLQVWRGGRVFVLYNHIIKRITTNCQMNIHFFHFVGFKKSLLTSAAVE